MCVHKVSAAYYQLDAVYLVPNYTIKILRTEYTMLYPWTLALYYHVVTEINRDGDESSVVDRPGDYMDTLLGACVYRPAWSHLLVY